MIEFTNNPKMEAVNNDTANREFRFTGMLLAPVETVWEAWTNPSQIENWWGPKGFTNSIQKMDVVSGGEWSFTMHGPGEKRYPNKAVFLEIIPFKKIMFQHFNPDFIATVVFEHRVKETFIDWTMLFETTALFETVIKVFRADEGLVQTVEKLENYLAKNKVGE